MIYDEEDWVMPLHQKAALLQPIQIDLDCEYINRARSYEDPDAEHDFRYWQDLQDQNNHLEKQRLFRYRTDRIREARRTIATMQKRKYRMGNKNYARELDKYNRAVQLLKDEGVYDDHQSTVDKFNELDATNDPYTEEPNTTCSTDSSSIVFRYDSTEDEEEE